MCLVLLPTQVLWINDVEKLSWNNCSKRFLFQLFGGSCFVLAVQLFNEFLRKICIKRYCFYMTCGKPRLARGVGSGQTTMQHARAVGAIFGDEIFNQFLNLICGIDHIPPDLCLCQAWAKWRPCSCCCSAIFCSLGWMWNPLHATSSMHWIWWQWWTSGGTEGMALCFTTPHGTTPSCRKKNSPLDHHTWWELIQKSFQSTQVQSLVDAGFLKLLVNFAELQGYWNKMLLDFPTHPAATSPTTSIPFTMYGHLTNIYRKQ